MRDDRTDEQRTKAYKKLTDMAIEMGAKATRTEGFVTVNNQLIDLTATAPTYKWIGYTIIKTLTN